MTDDEIDLITGTFGPIVKELIAAAVSPLALHMAAQDAEIAALKNRRQDGGFAGALRSQDGHLVVSLADGRLVDVGPIAGKRGPGVDPATLAQHVRVAVADEVGRQMPAHGLDAAALVATAMPALETGVRDMVAAAFAALPPPAAGEDFDPEALRAAVAVEVSRQFAAQAPPRDGVDGKDGADGKDGEPGLPGNDGADGKDGEAGLPGADGKDGEPGLPGKDGEPGLPGKDGADGKDGEAGLPGKDGADGKDGEQGLAGKDGSDGKDGEPGLAGKDGADGKDGEPGLPGKDGADGKDGEAGLPGKDGADGKDGELGLAGKDGDDGKDGDPGLPGKDGANGKDGEHGANGRDGADGKDGEAGLPGKDGADGKNGEPGADGKNGADGKDGEPGLSGKDGADGKDGEAWEPGKDGNDGKDGRNGVDGKDGAAVVDALIDRDGVLVVTLSNGLTKSVGTVVGRDADMEALAGVIVAEVAKMPRPRDGVDGRDGLGFDDLEVVHDGERALTLRFTRDGVVREFVLAIPAIIDRGVWREGKFAKGDGVTWDGSFFVAQCDTAGRPLISRDWRQAVKAGRPGKNTETVKYLPASAKLPKAPDEGAQ